MNKTIETAKYPKRTITWLSEAPAAACAHQFEIIAYRDPSAPRRCAKCGDREAK